MFDLGPRRCQAAHDLRQSIGVGSHRVCAIHRLLVARGRDQFHRPRDLADVANRLASFVEGAGIGHESVSALAWLAAE